MHTAKIMSYQGFVSKGEKARVRTRVTTVLEP